MEEMRKLNIIGISYNHSLTDAFALIMETEDEAYRLPIIINTHEGNIIALKLEKEEIKRPLTHDLFKSFADTFLIKFHHIIISRFSQGIFYAQIICSQENTPEISIDARPSDAIILALNFDIPIYVTKSVINDAGIDKEHFLNITQQPEIEEQGDEPHDEDELTVSTTTIPLLTSEELKKLSLQKLETLIGHAIEREEYEKASIIQQEINRRKETDNE